MCLFLSDTDYIKAILVASTTAVASEGRETCMIWNQCNARSIYEEVCDTVALGTKPARDLSVGRLGFVVLTSHAMRKYNFTDNVCVKTRWKLLFQIWNWTFIVRCCPQICFPLTLQYNIYCYLIWQAKNNNVTYSFYIHQCKGTP